MEGISHEVCSLAGTLTLGKLIVFYDDNGISIDGEVVHWFTDNTAMRFEAYAWQVLGPIDGHDFEAIEKAIIAAKNDPRPTLIICKTTIGLGSPRAGTESVHGAPLGAEGVQKTRDYFDWQHAAFEVPEALYAQWDYREKGKNLESDWLQVCDAYQKAFPADYQAFLAQINGDLPINWASLAEQFIDECRQNQKALATRQSSQHCIEYWAKFLPALLGGSADLTGSNLTNWSGSQAISSTDFSGNYLFYGVREFGMSAIMNGLALHGGVIPYGGTFLVFSDYARNAIRLSAIMGIRVIYVLTHDSIGLGEDGPTHQPVEHAAMLRMTPGLDVWRPADLIETAVAWQKALERHDGPSCLLLSRQSLPVLNDVQQSPDQVQKGGYILVDTEDQPDLILIATGSEVHLALNAARQVTQMKVRVVSMPCCERFLSQEPTYQEHVLPKTVRRRLAIEAAKSDYWYQFVGLDGHVMGVDRFGASAPAQDVYRDIGITVEKIVAWMLGEENGNTSRN